MNCACLAGSLFIPLTKKHELVEDTTRRVEWQQTSLFLFDAPVRHM